MKIVRITAMWCMSCLSMKKTWKKALKEYPNIDIIDLDFDFNEEEVKKYNVGKTLPELIVFNDGVEIKRIVGEKTLKEMNQILEVLNEKN
ncbi:MAG: thioredoxin family protein [Tenericutes bacterium]|nr:thioredoxin family protein [Mycoplasmatota bacterium]